MKKSKLDAPHIKRKIVSELATGRSQSSIAKEVGLHPSQVSRFANREDIKIHIEKESFRLMEAVSDAVQNVINLVAEMRDIPKEDSKRMELCYKASTDVLKAAGLLPTPLHSQTFISVLNQTNNVQLDPIIKELLESRREQMQLSPEDKAMLGWKDNEEE